METRLSSLQTLGFPVAWLQERRTCEENWKAWGATGAPRCVPLRTLTESSAQGPKTLLRAGVFGTPSEKLLEITLDSLSNKLSIQGSPKAPVKNTKMNTRVYGLRGLRLSYIIRLIEHLLYVKCTSK